MNINDALHIALAGILSVGSAGGIFFGLSNFFGKMWAERFMAKERRAHEKELEEIRAKLEKTNEESLSKLRTELEIYRDTHLKRHNDKLETYRLAFDVIVGFLADMNLIRSERKPEGDPLDRFERGRLKAHCNLGLLAPQKVMDAYDAFVENIFSIFEVPGNRMSHENWNEMRRLGYDLLNVMREDIGIDKSRIEYRGSR